MRELSTEIARLTNEMAGLRATPAVPQGRSVWLLVREDDESDAVMMYFEKPDETGFKDRFKLREFVLVERTTTAPAPAAGILDRARWGGQVANLMRLAEAADKAVASMTVPAPEAGSESKIVIDVGPGGSGGGPAEAAPPATEQTAPAPAQGEPFGHFRPEPFGWTDCAEDDEGAIALYERPQEVDESQLEKMRERGATAWAGVDAQSLRAGGEPAQEIDKSVADAEIKAMYVESQGSDKGWLGIEGSYFIGGVVAARKQKAAPAPAQEVASAFTKALDIRLAQGWNLTGNAIPVLYTDTINDYQVRRDDVWLCTTDALKTAAPVGLTDEQTLKDAYQEGYYAHVTYNDAEESDLETEWSKSSTKAIIAAHEAKQATAPAVPQEVGLTDEERADMACAVAAICTGTSSRTVAATAIEWTERALRAKGGK